MKAVILGGEGQLGQDLLKESLNAGIETLSFSKKEADVTDEDGLRAVLENTAPDIIFNTAAMHNLDDCEEDPEKARLVNQGGVLNIKRAVPEALLVYISTNYVFDGKKEGPYLEDDSPNPIQEYGKSKLLGEIAAGDDSLIIRTAGLYGAGGAASKGGNFVDKILARKDDIYMVEDQIINPTSTKSLARSSLVLALEGFSGIVHLTDKGACSWFEFAKKILEISGKENKIIPAKTAPDSFVQRPLNGSLESIFPLPDMPHWQDALQDYISEIS